MKRLLAVLFIAILATHSAVHTVHSEGPADPGTIRVGQSVRQTTSILIKRGITFGEGGFALARLDHDQSNLYAVLDKHRTLACIYYSKSSDLVTRVSLVFYPSERQHNKLYASRVPVTSLRINKDRSYVAHFEPPLTDEQLQRSRNQQPKPERPPRKPTSNDDAIALDGYCPVTLLEQERWEQGDSRWQVRHRDQVFFFAGPTERQRFLEVPERYSPMVAGKDIVLAKDRGEDIAGRRRHGLFYRGKLFLFSGEETLRRFWDNPQQYVDSALETKTSVDPTQTSEKNATWDNTSGPSNDRIKILSDVSDQQDLRAIQVAVEWLKETSDEPLDVEVKVGRNKRGRSVHFNFVCRNDNGEPFFVPGGHCTVTVSEAGKVVDVLKGA